MIDKDNILEIIAGAINKLPQTLTSFKKYKHKTSSTRLTAAITTKKEVLLSKYSFGSSIFSFFTVLS